MTPDMEERRPDHGAPSQTPQEAVTTPIVASTHGFREQPGCDSILEHLDAVTVAWTDGYATGLDHGLARGARQALADVAAGRANRLVARLADLPEVHRAAARRRAHTRAARFGGRA